MTQRLTTEKVEELELNYKPWGNNTITDLETGDAWEFINESAPEYDEGTVTTQLVWRHVSSGELWGVDFASNSWSDYYETFEPYLVVPKEITTTIYKKKV